MKVQIVHISDLHFKNDIENRTRVNDLLADLRQSQTNLKRYIAFTGDLVHSGDENDYGLLLDTLIMPLLDLGADIFVIPGNHDIQRLNTQPAKCNALLDDRTGRYLYTPSGVLNLESPFGERNPLGNYGVLEEVLSPYDQQNYYGYLANRESIAFVGINTTWLSCERTAGDSDVGKLRLEPLVLKGLISGIPPGSLRVALMHHPIDWLEADKREEISQIIVENFDIVLFGHVHSSDAASLTRDQSNCLFVQSPPLRAGWSRGNNGYAMITCAVREKAFQIEYRSYSEPRRVFVTGEEFADRGVRYPRKSDQSFFLADRISRDSLLSRYASMRPFDYTNWYRSHIRAKSKTTGPFVVPKAVRLLNDKSDTIRGIPQSVTTLMSQSTSNQFFIAPQDAGSTTASFLALKHLSETQNEHQTIPAYFDASRDKINRASILRAAIQTCLCDFSHTEVEQLANSGAITFVVDGLCLGEPDQFNLFRQTLEKHFPKVRFVAFANTDKVGATSRANSDLALSIEVDEIYEFAQMEVADIRDMVISQRPDLQGAALEAHLAHVVSCFHQMDEPIFASSVAVVLDTLRQDPEFKPVNKARLIERYVECLLGRFDLEDVREGKFNSSDKIDLLSFVAKQFLTSSATSIEEMDWATVIADYERTYLLELPKNLLEEFLTKGILTAEDGRVTFRGDHMYSFFIARQMKNDPNFAQALMQDHGLFLHHKEVVVYAELEGTSITSILDSVCKLLGELETGILEAYSRDGIDLTTEWETTCKEQRHVDHSEDEAAKQLNGKRLTQEQADRLDNRELAMVDRRRGVAERSEVKEAEARFLVAMTLYSLLIRNSMQVPATEKLRHLTRLFDYAEIWVDILCAHRGLIGIMPVVIAGGVQYFNSQAAYDKDKSIADFKYNAPNSISSIVSKTLSNPLISPAIRELISKLEPMQALFARDSLLEMPGRRNADLYIESLSKVENRVLLTSSLRTLRTKYLASGRSSERSEHLDYIVGEIAKLRSRESAFNLDSLKRSRVVQDLRERATKSRQRFPRND